MLSYQPIQMSIPPALKYRLIKYQYFDDNNQRRKLFPTRDVFIDKIFVESRDHSLQKYIQMNSKKLNTPKGYQLICANGVTCQLGFGSCGSVQLARCLKTGQMVAIKKINHKFGQHQVDFHLKLHHPNIIKLLDYTFDEKNQCSYLILQYAQNGTLFNYIRENGGESGIKDRRIINGIFHSICDAVEYMHVHKIMHRDIKPENILLDRKNVVKLCDFGFAANKDQRTTIGGTAEYMAPEILMRKPYNYKVDIWALGVLYYELIQGSSPFHESSIDQLAQTIQKPITFSNKFRQDQIRLITSILKINPEERPQISQIIADPCLKVQSNINTVNTEINRRSTADQSINHEQPKIKLMQIKDLVQSPDRKKMIQIMSVKNLDEWQNNHVEESTPTSPKSMFNHKAERTSMFLAKQRISLKRVTKKL